jgi:hypothetical protein
MGQQREAEAMGWMARNTGPNAPPQRPGKGAAGACVSPCARRCGWGSAGVVLAPAMAPPRSADSVCVSGGASGFLHPSAPDETCTWFWGRLAS